MKLIFATHNSGKIKEMRDLLADLEINVLSAHEAGVTEDVVEDGMTFEENALEEKNSLSHRGRAFEQLKTFLREQLSTELG